MKRIVWQASLLILLLFINSGLLLAQVGASTAEVAGKVTDKDGALVVGAGVTAIAVDKGFSRSATTNQDGEYTLLSLPPGSYDIRAEKAGFSPQRLASVQLTVGQSLHLDFVLPG